MSRQFPRRLGAWFVLSTGPLAAILVLIAASAASAQKLTARNVLQMPQAPAQPAPLHSPPPPSDQPRTNLPVIVADRSGHPVEWLSGRDFSLRVGGDDREVQGVRHGRDAPAAIGIITDVSVSMRWRIGQARDAIRLLALTLGGRNPIFLAGFARHFHLIEPYTSDASSLDRRLTDVAVSYEFGDEGTALYDSIIKGTTVLAHGPSSRRALVAITDGQDTISWHGVEDAIAAAQRSGVVVYILVVERPPIHDYFLGFDDSGSYLYRDTLFRICAASGGRGFMVYNPDSVTRAAQQIASDLDSQYVLEFAASTNEGDAQSVELFVKNHPGMQVRAPQVVRLAHDQPDPVATP